MTNRQIQFLIWLITTAIDKCQTIGEARELNKEIRIHSDGLIDELSDDGVKAENK